MPRKKQSAQTDAKKPTPTPIAKAPHGSKSAFVRALPQSLSAKEVVEKAMGQGMKLSIAQVYNIRSTAKNNTKAPKAAKPVAIAAVSRRVSVSSDAESQMRKLIAEVGLARARQVLAEVGAAFAG